MKVLQQELAACKEGVGGSGSSRDGGGGSTREEAPGDAPSGNAKALEQLAEAEVAREQAEADLATCREEQQQQQPHTEAAVAKAESGAAGGDSSSAGAGGYAGALPIFGTSGYDLPPECAKHTVLFGGIYSDLAPFMVKGGITERGARVWLVRMVLRRLLGWRAGLLRVARGSNTHA